MTLHQLVRLEQRLRRPDWSDGRHQPIESSRYRRLRSGIQALTEPTALGSVGGDGGDVLVTEFEPNVAPTRDVDGRMPSDGAGAGPERDKGVQGRYAVQLNAELLDVGEARYGVGTVDLRLMIRLPNDAARAAYRALLFLRETGREALPAADFGAMCGVSGAGRGAAYLERVFGAGFRALKAARVLATEPSVTRALSGCGIGPGLTFTFGDALPGMMGQGRDEHIGALVAMGEEVCGITPARLRQWLYEGPGTLEARVRRATATLRRYWEYPCEAKRATRNLGGMVAKLICDTSPDMWEARTRGWNRTPWAPPAQFWRPPIRPKTRPEVGPHPETLAAVERSEPALDAAA